MLLRIKLATSGFVPENADVDFLNTYFHLDPVEEEEEGDSEPESDEDEREDDDEMPDDEIPDDKGEIHRIDEESRRLDEIYYGVR
ncbi:MAG: hypothetical protein ACHQJ4_06560 [Ignavibacteria bacterium]